MTAFEHGAILLRRAAPKRIDLQLFVRELTDVPTGECDRALIGRFNRDCPSGIVSIDVRLRRDDVCFAIVRDGAVLHESWLLQHVRYPSRFGYNRAPVIGDCFTAPSARGQGIYRAVLEHIVRELAELGSDREVQMLVEPSNAASKAGMTKAGFRGIARLRAVSIGGLLLARRNTPFDPGSPH